jgi:hypothetical protein
MLHKETVGHTTLELIETLQADSMLEGFLLVGETALSLQMGHRISIDIDFFTQDEFDTRELLEYLEQKYAFQLQYMHHNKLKGIINGVFVDLLRHNYKLIATPLNDQNIKMASMEDIAAMKINAIAGNGTRVKDFIDFYFLLNQYTFGELINFYVMKYENRNDFHIIKSLTYFDDIIVEDWPQMYLEKDLTFTSMKKRILAKRDEFLAEKINNGNRNQA